MLRRFFLCLCLGWCVRLLADDIALVSVGDTWRYQLGTVEPSSKVLDWTRREFDDGTWLFGDSGFGFSPSGYGENTPLGTGTGLFASTYFRKGFLVQTPAEIRSLTLRLDWQGGFVAFLNGTEILRANLTNSPAGFVPFDQRAEYREPNGAIDFEVSAAIPLLRPGTNLLAIQLHTGTSSADYLVLVPELLANFTRGPLTRNITQDRATIVWDTPKPTSGRVEFGASSALGSIADAGPAAVHHTITLTNLPAGRDLLYRVTLQDGTNWTQSPLMSLRTLPASGDVSFSILGDTGAGTAGQFAIAKRLARRPPNVVLHLGDVVYPMFTFPYTDTRCLSVYRETLRSVPYYFVWGNHDLYAGEAPFIQSLMPPTNAVSAAEHALDQTRPEFFYSFDAGDVHVAVVFQPYASQYLLTPTSPQLRWLEADLRASRKPWKWIALHLPLNTSGLHRLDDRNLDGIPDRLQLAALLYPLAQRTGVQLVLAGHDHSYERLRPTNGVHHLVSGGGGSVLYPLTERDPASAHFESRYHLVEITLHDDVLRWQAVGASGEVFDSTEFRRTDPASEDPDGDGLSTAMERILGTNPNDPDTDGDGLPDGWEWMNGTNPLVADGADGPDFVAPGDSLSNRGRFLAEPPHSDPVQLRGTAVKGGGLDLRWIGKPDVVVRLESSASADGPYAPLEAFGMDRGAASGTQSLQLPSTDSARFFRMHVVR